MLTSEGLLHTSSESRSIVLNSLPASLPSTNGTEVLRFHPEKTTIYINNFFQVLQEVTEENYGVLEICEDYCYKFEGIQRVAIHSDCFDASIDVTEKENATWCQIFYEMFPDLKTIVAVRDPCWPVDGTKEEVEAWFKMFSEDEKIKEEMSHPFPQLEFHEGMLEIDH
jgi:hypothetical protein